MSVQGIEVKRWQQMSLRPRNKEQSAMKWQLELNSELNSWYDSLKSFNAEPEQAAMHKANWLTDGSLTNRDICQPAFAACAGDGTCGSQTPVLTLLGCEFLRSGTRQEFRQPP